MVDDPPFAAFLDALLAALEAVGAIVAGSQTSFDDMVGAWAGAAPPAVRGSFDIATDPERVLVELLEQARADVVRAKVVHLWQRAEARRSVRVTTSDLGAGWW